MKQLRAPWAMWILIGVGTLAASLFLAVAVLPGVMEPMFDSRQDIFGLPADLVILLAGGVVWLIGWVWLVRIINGPGEEPPPWRYRRRR